MEKVGTEMQVWKSMGERIELHDDFSLSGPAHSRKELGKILFAKYPHLGSIPWVPRGERLRGEQGHFQGDP